MKKIFIAMLSVLAFTGAQADLITPEKASAIAQEFFEKQESRRVPSAVTTAINPRMELAYTCQNDGAQASYYIFNKEDGNGFVIVSAESGTRQILAYSNEGAFQVEHIEHGPADFLKSYEQEINAVRCSARKAPTIQTGSYQPKLLTTANFHQDGYSFNDSYAPKIDGKSCLSGCVATAMAILMKYHNWPTKNTGSHSYTAESGLELSCDFSSITFDWENMKDNPDISSSDAVSNLQRACGIAVNMEYGVDESWAYYATVNYALRHYFYYDFPYQIQRAQYETEEWNDILRSEIDSDRPVFIGGLAEIGGHAYVLDGYDQEGIFHYNLGWGGVNNGYYTEGYVTEDCYANTDAIIGIQPRSLDQEDFTSPIQYASITLSMVDDPDYPSYFNLDISTFNNMSNVAFAGKVRADLYDKDMKFKANIHMGFDESSDPLESCYYYSYYYFYYCYIPNNIKVDPSDRIVITTSTDNGKTWNPIYCSSDHFKIINAYGETVNSIDQTNTDILPGTAAIYSVDGKHITTLPMQQGTATEGLKSGIYIIRNSEGKAEKRMIP